MSTNLDTRVLAAMTVGLDTAVGLRVSLGASEHEVLDALARLTQSGLVRADDDGSRFVLTTAGAQVAAAPGRTTTASFGEVRTTVVRFGGHPEPEWRDVGDAIAQAWTSTQAARADAAVQRAAARAERDKDLLVTDAEREATLDRLTQAYGDGRLTEAEHEERAHRALQARTRRDLDDVVTGLSAAAEGPGDPGHGHRTAVLVLAILAVPFVVLAVLLLARP